MEAKYYCTIIIYKRGDTESVGNYRGISLLCTAYKWYAKILRIKLKEEVEKKNIIPETQTGFRKGRSTMDNIFVLNHLIQKSKRRERKVYALCGFEGSFRQNG